MEAKKLTEENLTQAPEEVFDILTKLGEGSYGSVYKARHKESKEIFAIKQVPLESDFQETIKEISIMQQCDSSFVVKYYGSYFRTDDLWIIMEYCGAGSVLDIMKARGKFWGLPKGKVKTLSEVEMAIILKNSLSGLEYLHLRKKIHMDIKAANILLTDDGHVKLADFGVAGQLTDTLAKRNTFKGTASWIAPEVINATGYNCLADIWSLGITSLEMAEGKAPYAELNPFRVIFIIPKNPPPTLKHHEKWSDQFIEFVSKCLVMDPECRSTASTLLEHDFMKNAKTKDALNDMIAEAKEAQDQFHPTKSISEDKKSDQGSSREDSENGTMIELESSVNTMIIDQSATLKRSPCADITNVQENGATLKATPHDANDTDVDENDSRPHPEGAKTFYENEVMIAYTNSGSLSKFADMVRKLSDVELAQKLANLDHEMEQEIGELRSRHRLKLQPILDAIDQERKNQQNF